MTTAATPPLLASVSRVLRLGGFALGSALLPFVAWGLYLKAPEIAARLEGARPHGFDTELFALQPLVIQVHVALAITSVALGAWMLVSKKGARWHRRAGWVWVVAMAGMMLTSLFIVSGNGSTWSYIHITSVTGLALLTVAVLAARRHVVASHRLSMLWLYWGWLIGAGLFTFIPGRLMWGLFFG